MTLTSDLLELQSSTWDLDCDNELDCIRLCYSPVVEWDQTEHCSASGHGWPESPVTSDNVQTVTWAESMTPTWESNNVIMYTQIDQYVRYLLFLIAKVEMISILQPQCTDDPGEHSHGETWHHQRWWCEESTWSVVICCSCHNIISALTLASETWVTTDQGPENIYTHESELLVATDPLPPVLLISSLCLLEYRVFKKN